jgi:hypothetical protein
MSTPSEEELIKAIDKLKTEHPEFGLKRVWSFLKTEHGWEISEKRVKKFLDLAKNADAVCGSSSAAPSLPSEKQPEQGPSTQEHIAVIAKMVEQRPSPRCYFSFTVCPLAGVKDELPRIVKFGGEYYDGAKNLFYNDTYLFQMDYGGGHTWNLLNCENKPGTRSAHQACEWQEQLFIFGGEWSSQNGQKFKLFDDLWRLDLNQQVWERIAGSASGPAPSARSGHRMVCVDDQLILYGGAVPHFISRVFEALSRLRAIELTGRCPGLFAPVLTLIMSSMDRPNRAPAFSPVSLSHPPTLHRRCSTTRASSRAALLPSSRVPSVLSSLRASITCASPTCASLTCASVANPSPTCASPHTLLVAICCPPGPMPSHMKPPHMLLPSTV